jgi:formylglycine-generating enzyme required for sulfatase activity
MAESTVERRIVVSRYQRTGKHFIESLSDDIGDDLENAIGLDMVLIPGGQFMMGAPPPQRHLFGNAG